ncbi:MAG TPA: metallophosphoesterase [Rhizomicrobium sp.]|nr:metallophosphoesterase [Rhizomicrobium sp.]
MKRYIFLAVAALLAPAAAPAAEPSIAAGWVQLGPGGAAEIREIVNGRFCPEATVNGAPLSMTPRAAASADFQLVCSAPLPANAKSLAIEGHGLALPVADPQRILVLGDTGCRIKGTAVQACNDPKAWPFAGLAAAAAALKPDLVVHLGDYLYRESPCPAGNAGCAGSPYGDSEASWDADFFTPAAPLLAAAPWIVIRGNHEDCSRAGPGFLRLLGPVAYDPAAPCTDHLEPYAVPAGSQTIAVMDSASAPDTSVDPRALPLYQQDFAALQAMATPGHPLWLATHRPIWAAITGPLGIPIGGNATMIAAAGDLSAFSAISLMLAGHIHTFEAINYDAKLPPQIVAGHGGDNLDVTPLNLHGTVFQGHSGVAVKDGLSVRGFGFLMMTREAGGDGWSIQLYDSDGAPTTQCAFEGGRVFCLKPR